MGVAEEGGVLMQVIDSVRVKSSYLPEDLGCMEVLLLPDRRLAIPIGNSWLVLGEASRLVKTGQIIGSIRMIDEIRLQGSF